MSGLLASTARPFLCIAAVTGDDETRLAGVVYGGTPPGAVVRVLVGSAMRTRKELMREFRAALQFFEGFGGSWHALRECLCYLDEWLPATAYTIIIAEAHEVLCEDDPSESKWFTTTIDETGEWWSLPVRGNPPFDRPARPFHVVMKTHASLVVDLERRFLAPVVSQDALLHESG